MRIAFLGFGLIAGSIARAVRANGDAAGWTMTAWSPSGGGPTEARADGIIDLAAATTAGRAGGRGPGGPGGPRAGLPGRRWTNSPRGARRCCRRTRSSPTLPARRARSLRGPTSWGSGTSAATRWPAWNRRAIEQGAPTSSSAGRGSSCPGALPGTMTSARVESLARACGAEPLEMDAEAHDQAVAGISHLPLLLSAALAEAVTGTTPGEAGAGWATAARDWPRAAGGT